MPYGLVLTRAGRDLARLTTEAFGAAGDTQRIDLLGYTIGMKTAVSVPDTVFERAEKLARRMRKSRSQFYSDALVEYVARHDPAAVTAALDALYEEEDSKPDPFVLESARRVLRSTDW